MIPQPAPSSDSVSVPAFAQRIALSVLALEIDELLHRSRRSGGDSSNSRASFRSDSTSHPSTPANPQPTHSS